MRRLVLWSVAAVFFCNCSASAIIIDKFQSDQNIQTATSDIKGTADPSALGGHRKIQGTVSFRPVDSYLKVGVGTTIEDRNDDGVDEEFKVYAHSQDTGLRGSSRIIWDGSSGAPIIDFQGLGGIDLTADGSNKFQLDIVELDHPVVFEIRVYDSRDPSGAIFASATRNFDPAITAPGGLYDIDFPKAKASALSSAGAIELIIDGSTVSSLDLRIAAITTNGDCTDLVPDGPFSVDDDGECCPTTDLDDCKVCYGNNADKDDCGVCFGDNRDKDDCKVCFGKNKDKGCDGVCFSKKVEDACGICGGDNGSYLGCTVINSVGSLQKLNKGIKRQQRWLKQLALKGCASVGQKALRINSGRKISTSVATILSTFPEIVTFCTNEDYCVKDYSFEYSIKQVKGTSQKLLRMSRKLVKEMRACPPEEACTKGPEICRQGLELRLKKLQGYMDRARRLHNRNLSNISNLPKWTSECAC